MRDQSRWDRLQALFDATLALAPGERPAFVARCAETDPELAADLSALVRAGGEAGAFIERAILDAWEDGESGDAKR